MKYVSKHSIVFNWGAARLNWPKGHVISHDLYEAIPDNIKVMFEPCG